jgi:hypothetical protein
MVLSVHQELGTGTDHDLARLVKHSTSLTQILVNIGERLTTATYSLPTLYYHVLPPQHTLMK